MQANAAMRRRITEFFLRGERSPIRCFHASMGFLVEDETILGAMKYRIAIPSRKSAYCRLTRWNCIQKWVRCGCQEASG